MVILFHMSSNLYSTISFFWSRDLVLFGGKKPRNKKSRTRQSITHSLSLALTNSFNFFAFNYVLGFYFSQLSFVRNFEFQYKWQKVWWRWREEKYWQRRDSVEKNSLRLHFVDLTHKPSMKLTSTFFPSTNDSVMMKSLKILVICFAKKSKSNNCLMIESKKKTKSGDTRNGSVHR